MRTIMAKVRVNIRQTGGNFRRGGFQPWSRKPGNRGWKPHSTGVLILLIYRMFIILNLEWKTTNSGWTIYPKVFLIKNITTIFIHFSSRARIGGDCILLKTIGGVVSHWLSTLSFLKCHRFGVKCHRFGVKCHRFGVKCHRFGVKCHKFRVKNRLRKKCHTWHHAALGVCL